MINMAVMTETKKKLKDSKELNDFIMIYNGESTKRAQYGIAILIDNK